MKYREIKKIETNGGISITPHGLFLIKVENEQKKIIQIDVNGNECDNYEFIDISMLYQLHFMNDYLIVSFKNDITSFYKYDKQKVYEIDKQLYFLFVQEDNIYIYIENDGSLCRFNKRENQANFSFISNDYLMLSCVFNNNLIFKHRDGKIFLYKNLPNTINLIWQLDVKSIFPNQEDVTIYKVKEYQGSLIVVTSVATLRLSVEDGSVMWKSGWGDTLEIVGNTGYVCTGLSLSKINLDTGEETGYGWEYHELPDFIYEGKNYWPKGHEVVYHDGLLWYSVYSSGKSFLIAINPDNGNYEWIHHVDTYEKTHAPQFYEDRMFLYDTGNTLHIYEKEKYMK